MLSLNVDHQLRYIPPSAINYNNINEWIN